MRPEIEFNEKNHRYKVDGEYFPSVTTIIDSVVPKNLSWWAMVVGVNATCALIRQGYATPEDDPENIVTAIRENKLSVYHIRDEKGEEGTAVHQAADRYAKTGEIPRLKDYSSEVQPKIKALANFLLDVRPKILKSEERVASLAHKYAGTFDWLVDIEGQRGIVDLKTGKRQLMNRLMLRVEKSLLPSKRSFIWERTVSMTLLKAQTPSMTLKCSLTTISAPSFERQNSKE
jgi:hypothetical protein